MSHYDRDKWHETQPDGQEYVPEEETYLDPQLQPLSRIEGAGPLKKVRLDQLPKWLRMFGYFLIVFFLIEMLASLYGTFRH